MTDSYCELAPCRRSSETEAVVANPISKRECRVVRGDSDITALSNVTIGLTMGIKTSCKEVHIEEQVIRLDRTSD